MNNKQHGSVPQLQQVEYRQQRPQKTREENKRSSKKSPDEPYRELNKVVGGLDFATD